MRYACSENFYIKCCIKKGFFSFCLRKNFYFPHKVIFNHCNHCTTSLSITGNTLKMHLEKFESGKSVPLDCDSDELPSWFDKGRFQRAQQFFNRNLSAMLFSLHISLVVGLSVPSFLSILHRTNETETPQKSIHRYLRTMAHIVQWHNGDITDNKSVTRRSIRNVKAMHWRIVAKLSEDPKLPCNKSMTEHQLTTKSHENILKAQQQRTLPLISQYDMALTQMGFFGTALLLQSKCGLRCSRQEMEDYIYLWRVIGCLLGIKDEYNAAAGNYAETYALVAEFSKNLVESAIYNPSPLFIKMVDTYCDGYNNVLLGGIPVMTRQSTLAHAYSAYGSKRPFNSLSVDDKLRFYWCHVFAFTMSRFPGFAQLHNIALLKIQKHVEQNNRLHYKNHAF